MTMPQSPALAAAASSAISSSRAPKELALHLAVATLLRGAARPDWRWSHFPAGERRDAYTARKLQAMGTASGWPDLILIAPSGVFHGLELKRAGAQLSKTQEDFQRWAISRGVRYAVARSIDEVHTIFASWGCLQADVKNGGAS